MSNHGLLEVSEVVRLLGWSEGRVLRWIFRDWQRHKLALWLDVSVPGTGELLGCRWFVSPLAIEKEYKKFGGRPGEGPVLKGVPNNPGRG